MTMSQYSKRKTRAVIALLIGAAVVSACGKKRIENIPDVADGTTYGTGNNGNNSGNGGGAGGAVRPGSQEDFVRSIAGDRVFFDTDRYNIDTSDQAILQSQAQYLARYPNLRITIEGHCDERGTRDYNLALGERRANAAKSYLASLGVNPARIQTVSYGKERPQAMGSNEQSYAQNRRAVTITVQ
jgi:peptidoglycan-associated lipoprotein